jgi:hypothetical protein
MEKDMHALNKMRDILDGFELDADTIEIHTTHYTIADVPQTSEPPTGKRP